MKIILVKKAISDNTLLKEYEANVYPLDKIFLLGEENIQSNVSGKRMETREVYNLEESIYQPMMEGPWEGIDARDVLEDAIKWWEIQLSEIDRIVARRM